MAKLNLNSMLNSVAVNDVVVTDRLGTGSQLAISKAPANLSQGWPKPIGPKPTNAKWSLLAMHMYGEATAKRTGRSDVSPRVGFFLLPSDCSDSSATSPIPSGWLAIDQGETERPGLPATRQQQRS